MALFFPTKKRFLFFFMEANKTRLETPDSTTSLKTGRYLLYGCAALYGLYTAFLLIEVLDFLSLLHSPPPGGGPTYDLVNVAYYIVEMIVCIALTFGFLLLLVLPLSGTRVAYTCLLVCLFRIGLVYYLYVFTTREYRWVPYIYKVANDFSDIMRMLMLPSQIILGGVAAWFWWRKGNTVAATAR